MYMKPLVLWRGSIPSWKGGLDPGMDPDSISTVPFGLLDVCKALTFATMSTLFLPLEKSFGRTLDTIALAEDGKARRDGNLMPGVLTLSITGAVECILSRIGNLYCALRLCKEIILRMRLVESCKYPA